MIPAAVLKQAMDSENIVRKGAPWNNLAYSILLFYQ